MLKLDIYDYPLPKDLIAIHPAKERTNAKLFHFNKANQKISHRIFSELEGLLNAGDVLVLNNTKVIPARIYGVKETGAKAEALLLKDLGAGEWECLLKPGGRIKKDAVLTFGDKSPLKAVTLDEPVKGETKRRIRFEREDIYAWLDEHGHIPLPPYIERKENEKDKQEYQTVFAQEFGAVAAPTAGLHFDEQLLKILSAKGVEIVFVTLHVGYGTFRPIQTENIEEHQMFTEHYEIRTHAAERINRAMAENRRVIACGTTSVRTLEAAAAEHFPLKPGRGETDLFIHPPYDFKIVSGLITNFHLPKTSLLLLVDAFLGGGVLMDLYEEAIREKYRFYSYGDAMYIEGSADD